MWRPEDEALLSRLEDEAILARTWERMVPGAPLLPPRAAGIVRGLHAIAGGPNAREAVLRRDDLAPMLALVAPTTLVGLPPALIHGLVVLHGAVGREALTRDLAPASLDHSLVLTMAGWLALGQEAAYLRGLADASLGRAATDDELRGCALHGIRAVGEIARRGQRERRTAASRSLWALSRIDDAIDASGATDPLARAARDEARKLRDGIVLELASSLGARMDDLATRKSPTVEIAAALSDAASAWAFAGCDPELERLVVRELPRFAWDLYREARWDELRLLLSPLEAPSAAMERRLLADADGADLAYRSHCAQVLVFRAELAATLDAQIVLARRALALCSDLRNARLVLADLLCARALRTTESPFGGAVAQREAERDVAEAETLFPEARRLPEARGHVGHGGGRKSS